MRAQGSAHLTAQNSWLRWADDIADAPLNIGVRLGLSEVSAMFKAMPR